jgi:DNA-binding beta-propeller fold protein YncE
MRWVRAGLVVLLGLWVAPLWAEQVNETWRSPFGTPTSVAVDPSDGSVWATTGASLMHVSASGSTLLQVDGFSTPLSVAVSPKDGSVWLVDAGNGVSEAGDPGGPAVLHLSASGTVLVKDTSFSYPWAVATGSSDGSVWVADTAGSVSHLGSDGSELWGGNDFVTPVGLAVNPSDGSCWVADEGIYDDSSGVYKVSAVVHLGANGTELWRSQS